MYFKKYNFNHALMFHHFHDDNKHKKFQGSISKSQFVKIIKFIGRKNIIDPKEFIEGVNKEKNKNKVCLTFDDGLLSQYDIALPVLEKYQIKAFFFPHTSIFTNSVDYLETYRYFRVNYFDNINNFYSSFFQVSKLNVNKILSQKKFVNEIKRIKKKAPFYSQNDIKFRIIRNNVLSTDDYNRIMKRMFIKKNFKPSSVKNLLFLKKKNIVSLVKSGHIIGLHSHTHPYRIGSLKLKDQKKEYLKNIEQVSRISDFKKTSYKSLAHPSGSFDKKMFPFFKKQKIKIAFRHIMTGDGNKINRNIYEIARQDHSNILKLIK